MINSYQIKFSNDEEILILYLDYNYEFGIDFKNFNKYSNMKKQVKDYIKKHNILFNGSKVALSIGGVILAILLVIENSNTNDIEFVYVNNDIIPNKQVIISNSTLQEEIVDNNSNSLEETDIINISKDEDLFQINNSINSSTNTNANQITDIKESLISNSTIKDVESDNNQNTDNSIKEVVNSNQTNINYDNKEETIDTSEKITIYRTNGEVITLSFEEYLIGVVAAEMPASFPLEALKAQAVVARTYALKKIENNEKLTDSVSTQCYKDNSQLKLMWGSSFNNYYQKIKSAVTDTNNQSIYYQNELIDAVYHSTSNGKTEDAIYVWKNDAPYLKSVDSSWDINTSSYLKTIKKDLTNVLSLLGIDNFNTNFEIISRDETGRVEKIKFGNVEFTGVEFRNLLGLRSADFDLEIENDNLVITTRGYGHGVGLSQYGASGMAKSGYNYIEILKHYYTGVDIK